MEEIAHMVVEEIDSDGTIYAVNTSVAPKWSKEEDYVVFVLQKQNWTTASAAIAICKKLGISKKRISFAGTKDRNALTTQLCSIYKGNPDVIRRVNIKDITILGAWYWDRKIRIGDLLGNRFKIKLKSVLKREKVYDIYYNYDGIFPNFFGPQRFGTRGNTHIVGKKILLGDFEGAVMEYLTVPAQRESEEIRAARRTLSETYNFKEALAAFPKHLKYERTILAHLAEHPRDFVGALRRLPRALLLMFVHAYQAYLFNILLEDKLKGGKTELVEEGDYYCGANWYGFPDVWRIGGKFPVGKIIGYRSCLNERERNILLEEGITQKHFIIKSMPELSSEGSYRPLLIPLKNFAYEEGIFTFELPAGSYATSVIREFLKAK